MGEVLLYRQISFDTAYVARPDRPFRAKFFEAEEYPVIDGSTRITAFDEKLIVRWLMLMEPVRRVILEELGLRHLNPSAAESLTTCISPRSLVRGNIAARLLLHSQPRQENAAGYTGLCR